MKEHYEEREIYGAIYVQDRKYFLLEPRPVSRYLWQVEGTSKWLVADSESIQVKKNSKAEFGDVDDYIPFWVASYIVVGSNAVIELLPVPASKKVIRFYVTDDEEA